MIGALRNAMGFDDEDGEGDLISIRIDKKLVSTAQIFPLSVRTRTRNGNHDNYIACFLINVSVMIS